MRGASAVTIVAGLVAMLVLAAQGVALAKASQCQPNAPVTLTERFMQLAEDKGGKATTIQQPNSCGSIDKCIAPPGGSCECHCEGTKSVCTVNYGKNGPPKK
jgi:hypothetical protein